MNLVIVESPAKAKTINKYLGDNYTVLASYGHIEICHQRMVQLTQNKILKWNGKLIAFLKNI